MTGGAELARLLRRAGDADVGAFARVYDATAPRAYGICRRLLADPAVVESTVEHAYRRVWLRAASYDAARGSAAAWVLAEVHLVAVARAHEPGVARCPTGAPGPATGPADRVLAQLSTLEWAAVELAYFGGRRHGEVAGLLGLSAATAQARIRDGLGRVRDLAATR